MTGDTNNAITNFIVKQLSDLNREIVEAAEDGDVIRNDIIQTKIDTLEELCEVIQDSYFSIKISRNEIWGQFDFDFDGVDAISQYHLYLNGQIIPCGSISITEKKGA